MLKMIFLKDANISIDFDHIASVTPRFAPATEVFDLELKNGKLFIITANDYEIIKRATTYFDIIAKEQALILATSNPQ